MNSMEYYEYYGGIVLPMNLSERLQCVKIRQSLILKKYLWSSTMECTRAPSVFDIH